jgi:arylformamidase
MVDFEAEYVTAKQAHRQYKSKWGREAAVFREAAGARGCLDVAYGDKPRQRLDIFTPANEPDGPVALFIHGGYWQWMDKSFFSHMAGGPNAHGITVAVAGYTLCPEATLAEIIDEMRKAVAFVAKRFCKPVTVCGHSAGGHLTACMLATDWRAFDSSLEPDTVAAGLAISGIFDLLPLVSTTLNKNLGLDVAEARRLSPLLWPPPAGKHMIAYVGAEEPPEYLRQSRSLVAAWKPAGVDISGVEIAGAAHFAAVEPLADPASAMTRELVELSRKP